MSNNTLRVYLVRCLLTIRRHDNGREVQQHCNYIWASDPEIMQAPDEYTAIRKTQQEVGKTYAFINEMKDGVCPTGEIIRIKILKVELRDE